MSDDLNEWKDIYGESAKSTGSEKVLESLKKIEKKDKRERLIIYILLPLTALVLVFGLPIFKSWYYLIGVGLMILGMIMITILMYKNRYSDEATLQLDDTKKFLRIQIERLENKMRMTSFYMWVYFLLLVVGINVVYVEALSPLAFLWRVVIGAGVSILCFVGVYFSIKKRMLNYQREIVPLVEKLEQLTTEF